MKILLNDSRFTEDTKKFIIEMKEAELLPELNFLLSVNLKKNYTPEDINDYVKKERINIYRNLGFEEFGEFEE